MWLPRELSEKKGRHGLVAVAIDKDKGSQHALKWATDHLLLRGQTVLLVHVKLHPSLASLAPRPDSTNYSDVSFSWKEIDLQTRELFLPLRCLCTRNDIQHKAIVLEDTDVAKALIDFVSKAGVDGLVIGSPSKSGFLRFKETNISANVTKAAPDFCNVYVISNGKMSSTRAASQPPPSMSPLRAQILSLKSTVVQIR